MRRLLSVIFAMVCLPLLSRAETPIERVKSYGDYYRHKEWTKVAGLFDSTALADFREMTAFVYELPDKPRKQAVSTLFGPHVSQDSAQHLSDTAYFGQFLAVAMNSLPENSGWDFQGFGVVGQVLEGDSLCHVVVRVAISTHERPLERMEVVSLRKRDETWGLLLQWPIKRIAELLLMSLSPSGPSPVPD